MVTEIDLPGFYEQLIEFAKVPGPPGPAATLVVGTTTTSAPGGNANVVNSGSSTAAVLDFTIPTGAQGPQGIQGLPGTGDVVGPAMAVVGELAIYSNTTGKLIGRLSPATRGN